MLDARNISVRYGKHLAVADASVTVGKGECVVILGANGAGKSSLLRGITAMVPRERGGKVHFDGEDIAAVASHDIVNRGIAYVPEGRGVFTRLSVDENLWLGSNPRHARSGLAAARSDVFRLFPKLSDRRNQIVGTMSGGEQQMVAIGRALMSNPSLLLLDEPSLGLAPIVASEMFAALAEVQSLGMSILIVEQNVPASLNLASRGYVLEAGRIVSAGTSKQLRDDPMVSRAFLGHDGPSGGPSGAIAS